MPNQSLKTLKVQGGIIFLINGKLQFDSRDESAYHEPLAALPLLLCERRLRRKLSALVLGGGDGLALARLLESRRLGKAVLVDYDKDVLRLGREAFAGLNRRALSDPRVSVCHMDAAAFLKRGGERFDLIIADFTSPDSAAERRLFALPFLGLVKSRLAPAGVFALNAVSPQMTPATYWSIYRTLGAASFKVLPLRVRVPSFLRAGYGDWGMLLASRSGLTGAEVQALASDLTRRRRGLDGKNFLSMLRFSRASLAAGLPLSRVLAQGTDMKALLNLADRDGQGGPGAADFSCGRAAKAALLRFSKPEAPLLFNCGKMSGREIKELGERLRRSGLALQVFAGGKPRAGRTCALVARPSRGKASRAGR